MTVEQEKTRTEEVKNAVSKLIQEATDKSYQQLFEMIADQHFYLLAWRDKKLRLLIHIIRIWRTEHELGRDPEETIFGRTAALYEIPRSAITLGQVEELYTIIKLALFRIEDQLPQEALMEGVGRVLALGLTPESIILTAREQTENEESSLRGFAEVLGSADLQVAFPQAAEYRKVLLDYLVSQQEEKARKESEKQVVDA